MTSRPITARFADSIRLLRLRVVTAWNLSSPMERATTIMLSLMIIGGVFLRVREVAYPNLFTFDEPFFVPNGHNYLLGVKDNNDHPPLFKMMVSLGILIFGFNGAGWRFPALCFGILSIVLSYWLGKAYFRSARAGLMAAAFIAADGFFISYSRVGLIDGVLTSVMLWIMFAALCARTWRGVLMTAVLVGLATGIKWNAVFITIPAVVTMLVVGRVPLWTLLLFSVVPFIQFGIWMLAFWLTGEPTTLKNLWDWIRYLLKKHVDMNKDSNPLNSSWYAWLIFYRPVVIKFTTHGVHKFYSSTLGNPIFWISLDLLILWTIIQSFARMTAGGGNLRARLGRAKEFLVGKFVGRAAVLVMVGWVAMMAPWTILRNKYSFQHYYLPPYAFGLLTLGGLAAYFERRRPKYVMIFVGLALVFLIYMAPIWGEFSMRESAANLRLVAPGWRP
jgi:dolichyl-phosphate-mannose--protein O-mannosyl transferase